MSRDGVNGRPVVWEDRAARCAGEEDLLAVGCPLWMEVAGSGGENFGQLPASLGGEVNRIQLGWVVAGSLGDEDDFGAVG